MLRCSFDFLVAYDGQNKQANELGRFCGKTFAGVSSTGNQMYLEFVTDDSDQFGGFQLIVTFTNNIVVTCPSSKFLCENGHCIDQTYLCDGDDDCGDDSDETGSCPSTPPGGKVGCKASEYVCPTDHSCIPKEWLCDGDSDCSDDTDEINCVVTQSSNCGQMVYTGEHGFITSPNYPHNYDNNEHCIWVIAVPGDLAIQLHFLDTFDLEEDPSCSYDKINIFSSDRSIHKGPFCGSTSPGTLSFPTNNITVEFVTDDSDPYRGFRLEYTAVTKS
ncbi:hypothetical protein CHS0354_028286 [Potamilus streckersoni]|uniref:CUB domain-containing protein n=1 Tax=Potamilus streckersoni TaxID=2493646 RepID=A0AAE0RTS2_9BIVA|nr:hypothetical protein CHS0354_028286 [Potamilus streckersoni]